MEEPSGDFRFAVLRIQVALEVKCVYCFHNMFSYPYLLQPKIFPRFFCCLRALCKRYIPIWVPCCFFEHIQAVNVLLQEKPDWDTAKKVLNRGTFLQDLKSFDKDRQPKCCVHESATSKLGRCRDHGMWYRAFLFSLLRVIMSIIVGASQIREANTTGSSRVCLVSDCSQILQMARTISQRRSWSNWQSTFEWICSCRLLFSC